MENISRKVLVSYEIFTAAKVEPIISQSNAFSFTQQSRKVLPIFLLKRHLNFSSGYYHCVKCV